MHEMSGVDASFLYFETPSSHMHVLGTIVVDVTDAPGWGADRVIDLVEERIELLPPFRRRVSAAMLRLHHPFWVDVPRVDVSSHVRRVDLRGGGMTELAAEVSTFAEQQLDRSRPLWECLVAENMAGGRGAVVFKVHHCAVDGVGAAKILGSLFDLTAEGRTPAELRAAKTEAKAVTPEPGLIDVALHTATGLALRPWKMARLLPTTAKALAGLVTHRATGESSGGAVPLTAPRLPFNGAITAGRAVAYVDVALQDVKDIKSAVGGTFNDAIIGICGTAFRRYLLARDELPDSSLIAVVPVSVRGGSADDDAGNRVSAMFTALGTDIADPVERLRAVRQANVVGKGDQAAIGDDLLQKLGELAPPNTTAAVARFYSWLRLADFGPVVHNVVISNVAGPPIPIHLAGAKVVGLYPLGPVLEGPGLNITVVSYVDRVGFGLIACSDSLPELDDLAAAFPEAVQEILEAVR